MNCPPWDEHDCSATGTLGRSGLKGWAAVDVLRANGIPINADIMSKVFPAGGAPKKKSATSLVPAVKAMKPQAGKKLGVLALLSALLTNTKRTDQLGSLGEVGAKLLQLPKGKLWQATLLVNSERPNLSYTCVVAASLGLPKDANNKIVFAELEAKVVGEYAIWLITEIQFL
jgi:hypothetical protein